jgi:hypothetical protein
VPLHCRAQEQDASNSFATQFVLGLGAVGLSLGVALVTEVSKHIAPRCRKLKSWLRNSHAPSRTKRPDSLFNEPRLEPTPPVVWQSRSDWVLHSHRRYRRYGGCSLDALSPRQIVSSDQSIREQGSEMELEGTVKNNGRFS